MKITMSVKSVPKCLSKKAIVIDTSRASTWERNRSPALTVIRTFHGKLTSTYTTAVFTRVINRTPVQLVVRPFHRNVILIAISSA